MRCLLWAGWLGSYFIINCGDIQTICTAMAISWDLNGLIVAVTPWCFIHIQYHRCCYRCPVLLRLVCPPLNHLPIPIINFTHQYNSRNLRVPLILPSIISILWRRNSEWHEKFMAIVYTTQIVAVKIFDFTICRAAICVSPAWTWYLYLFEVEEPHASNVCVWWSEKT